MLTIFCGASIGIGMVVVFANVFKKEDEKPVLELTEREELEKKKEYYEKYEKYFKLWIVLMVLLIFAIVIISQFPQNFVLQIVKLLLVFALMFCSVRMLLTPQFPEGYGEELANREKELIAKEEK